MISVVDNEQHQTLHNHLYLLTLEVDRLIVGDEYHTLPCHLTLVSRFKSELDFDELALAIKPIFEHSAPIQFSFTKEAIIGPKNTTVHLIEKSLELSNLHLQLVEILRKLNVTYTMPEYIDEGYLPHVSKRQDTNTEIGYKQLSNYAFLIKVEKTGNKDIRKIRAKFKLGC